LEAAEGKVEILLKQNGKLQPEPFDASVARESSPKK
jgi:exonuclease VII small subunit